MIIIKKIFIILILSNLLIGKSYAENFYFKGCKLSEVVTADYIIDIKKKVINVLLKTNTGEIQEWIDPIKVVQDNKIITKKIQSGAGSNRYFVYFLDKDSESIVKQNYKKQDGIDIFIPEGPKKRSFCKTVKADWDKNQIESSEINKEQKQILDAQKKLKKKQQEITQCKGNNYKEWTDCFGKYKDENSHIYTGEFKNGKIMEGTALYSAGAKYVGKFKNFKPHGQGTFLYSNGNKYIGDWLNGQNHGNGTKTWKNGEKYSGKFKDDKPHGKGTFISPLGEKYIGEFKNGRRHGQGTLKYIDGTTYVGQFIAGIEHGEGSCINQEGSSVECSSIKLFKKDSKKNENRKDILITGKKWIKLSKYQTDAAEKLQNEFVIEANIVCPNGYDILEQKMVVLEMDETPAFGTETVVKVGVEGVVECK